MGVVGVLLLLAGGWWAWTWLAPGESVTTDNAYVQGNVVVVTPQVSGTVLSVHTDATQRVESGQLLIRLDATDARNDLEHKSEQLARVVRETRNMYLQSQTLRSTLAVRESAVEKARVEVAHALEKLSRRQSLQASGMVSREILQDAQAAYDSARSELASAEASATAAREALQAQLALTAGVPIEQHPAIREAAVQLREAWLAVKRAEIHAPLSGFIAQRQAQVGQRVAAGANLLSIVALEQLWVEANFKENQVRDIRIGQPARLLADLYGDSVVYRGRVEGLGVGTGSAFALLPAQNATGNWVKVVQRVPIRIALEADGLASHPLRIGLSMRVEIDTRDRSGALPVGTPPHRAAAQTQVFDALETGADEAVRAIIEANLRPGLRPPREAITNGR
jgi:membrane fusion protein (multidrug efflux system)